MVEAKIKLSKKLAEESVTQFKTDPNSEIVSIVRRVVHSLKGNRQGLYTEAAAQMDPDVNPTTKARVEEVYPGDPASAEHGVTLIVTDEITRRFPEIVAENTTRS